MATYIVVCRGDRDTEDSPPAPYELATRTVFVSREKAEEYAAGVARSRDPIVVMGRWKGLRFGETRGGWPQPK